MCNFLFYSEVVYYEFAIYYNIRNSTAYTAFSGDYLELGFDLPFTDFLPTTMNLHFRIHVCITFQMISAFRLIVFVSTPQGDALDMNIQLPEMSTNRPVLLALASHARLENNSTEVFTRQLSMLYIRKQRK